MNVISYCDGSGKGFICAMFDYGEGYQRTHFGRIDDQVFHEYRAILFAVELMTKEHTYTLFNDNAGAIQHVNGDAPPPTTIIAHLVREIQKATEHIDVEFCWIKRAYSHAGVMLDTTARNVYAPGERGSSNNLERKLQNPNRYAHWPPEDKECKNCGAIITEGRSSCGFCGYVPKTGKIRM